MKTIVLGLDGVTFNLLNPLVERGNLSNLKKIMGEGIYGEMQNNIYLASPPAWTTLVTGVDPGEHGIVDFISVDKNYEFKLNLAMNKKTKAFWENLDKKSIIVNLPLTYPPIHDNENLTVVSGMLTPGLDSEFTYPKSLKREILREINDYKITLDWENYTNDDEKMIKELKMMINSRLRLFDYLMEKKEWDLFFGVIIATDRLQHLFWDEKNILEVYNLLDAYIGKLMDKADKEGINLMVVSDHGFGEVDELFYLNSWLKENDYLSVKKEASSYSVMKKVGINREKVVKVLKKLNVNTESLRMKLPERIKKLIPLSEKSVFQDLDWNKTKAFFFGFGNLYINKEDRFDNGVVSAGEVEDLKKELVEKLSRHIAVKEVHDGNLMFNGKVAEFAPDLVVVLKEKYALSKSIGDITLGPIKDMKADHLPEGVFFAYGDNIKENYRRDIKILDFAPTLYYSLVEKENKSFKGRTALDIFIKTNKDSKYY